MSDRKRRWLGCGLVATVGAGVVALTAMMNPTVAHADGADIGLVIGASGVPIPGSLYVAGRRPAVPRQPVHAFLPRPHVLPGDLNRALRHGDGVFTPEGLYPLTGAGVHQLLLNYPTADDGFPALSSSVGQGMAILESTIAADQAAGDTSTLFGYSQSSTVASYVMQQLDPSGTPQPDSGLQFLLVADPSNPNGGALERFAGFETIVGPHRLRPVEPPEPGFCLRQRHPVR